MAATFLDFLTRPNPETDATQSKDGPSTKIPIVYRPDKAREWTDVTRGNLEATFKDVLLGKTDGPKVKDAKDVSPEKREIFSEASVTALAVDWNEPIVQHSLEGAQRMLRDRDPGSALSKGDIYFMENTGRGNIADNKGKPHRPDWLVYQKSREDKATLNLVPGDSKPARKWKSEWIKSADRKLKRKARIGIQQIVKYMYHGNTRYSFILSEEELVVVRLSKFLRDMNEVKKRIEKQYEREFVLDSDGRFLEPDEEDDGDATSDVSRGSNLDPDSSFADATREVGLRLEYCAIPWSNNGTEKLTVNLTLWWLTVLAVQSASIKGSGTYTPLCEGTRGHSPEFVEPQVESQLNEETPMEDPVSPRKRKSKGEELHQPERKRRTQGVPSPRSTGEPSQTELIQTRASSRRRNPSVTLSEAGEIPSPIFRRPPRRIAKTRVRKRGDPYQSDSSAKSSSQATDLYQLSFQSV